MNVQDSSLRKALARGRTLPAEWYTDAKLFEREQECIFTASWNYIGRVEQVAKAGDFQAGRVGKVPVVIVRDEAGTVRAYTNVCRHRGSELVLEKCGNRRTLQCHYHAWTWGLDGTLRAAPHCQEQAGFNKADFPLTPLGVETFGPFIFINPGSASCSLAATLGQLPAIIRSAGADIDALKFRERREYAIQANWKVVVENFLECYHCAVSHPGFADLIDLDKYQVVPYDRCSVQRGPLKASARAAPGAIRRRRGPGRDLYLSLAELHAQRLPRRRQCLDESHPSDRRASLPGGLRVLLLRAYARGGAARDGRFHRSGPTGRHHHRRVGAAWVAIRVLQAGPIDSLARTGFSTSRSWCSPL